jgi:hypothetical protein
MEHAFLGIYVQSKVAKEVETEKTGDLGAWHSVVNRCGKVFYFHSAHYHGFQIGEGCLDDTVGGLKGHRALSALRIDA